MKTAEKDKMQLIFVQDTANIGLFDPIPAVAC